MTTIKNCDGTPFQLSGSLQQFNPNNPAINLFNRYDSEIIQLGGSPLLYYECFIQVQNIDKLYLEDRSKIWASSPIVIYGMYEPIEPQNPSGAFGIDGMGDVVFECNVQAVINAIGHMPKRGSRINTPHLNENWVIVDTRLTQFQLWSAYHLQIICEKFQQSSTDASSEQPNPKPYTIF